MLQVNAKLQAQLSQTDFRFLVEGIPGIVYLFSTKNGGIFYSSHVADILGFAPSQLISNPMLWHDSIHPEDIPQVNQIIQRVIEDKSFSIEYRIKDSNGKWHWFEDRSLEFKATNDDFLVIGHALDITERKETEKLSNDNQEKYQLLFTTMTEGVALNEIIYDENQEMVDYRIIEVNHAFYSTADYHDIQVIGNVATKLYGISSELIKSFWKTHKELNVTQYAKTRTPEQFGHITVKPLSNEFHSDLEVAEGVISNAGFELASECITLGKKMLVKPLAGQFEQQSQYHCQGNEAFESRCSLWDESRLD